VGAIGVGAIGVGAIGVGAIGVGAIGVGAIGVGAIGVGAIGVGAIGSILILVGTQRHELHVHRCVLEHGIGREELRRLLHAAAHPVQAPGKQGRAQAKIERGGSVSVDRAGVMLEELVPGVLVAHEEVAVARLEAAGAGGCGLEVVEGEREGNDDEPVPVLPMPGWSLPAAELMLRSLYQHLNYQYTCVDTARAKGVTGISSKQFAAAPTSVLLDATAISCNTHYRCTMPVELVGALFKALEMRIDQHTVLLIFDVALDSEAWQLAHLAFRFLVADAEPLAYEGPGGTAKRKQQTQQKQQRSQRTQQQQGTGSGTGANLLASIGGVGGKGNTTKLISCLRRLIAAVLAGPERVDLA
jgi:hypothetical protein